MHAERQTETLHVRWHGRTLLRLLPPESLLLHEHRDCVQDMDMRGGQRVSSALLSAGPSVPLTPLVQGLRRRKCGLRDSSGRF